MKTVHRAGSALLAALLFFSLFTFSAKAASYAGTVNKDKVFFRSKPNTDSIYYAVLKKGTKVTITGSSGQFIK